MDHRLRIVRPILRDFVHPIEVRRLRLGQASIDLKFVYTSDLSVAVKALKVDGQLDIIVEF
ncbi:MAG TPA: hypothetical protein VNM22_06160 [Candidatus Limnocylindrales bacterium]|nr:hypothetical protein [Candidatus Limnocylindrales bacterium]